MSKNDEKHSPELSMEELENVAGGGTDTGIHGVGIGLGSKPNPSAPPPPPPPPPPPTGGSGPGDFGPKY
jgi:hypothetical protein